MRLQKRCTFVGIFSLSFLLLGCGSKQDTTTLHGLRRQGDDKLACVNLKDGQSTQVVNLYESGLTARYTLARKGSSYDASFNFTFVSMDDVIQQPALDRMRARTESCFAEVSKDLKGPNGESLALHLVKSGPAPVTIHVGAKVYPGDWDHWLDTWSCKQIVHEVFHHTGLVDLYPEPSLFVNDCRAHGPLDSVMGNPEIAKPSYLYASEFAAVTHPGCSTNRVYYQCAAAAYRTSAANGGIGCPPRGLPPECKGGNQSWITGA